MQVWLVLWDVLLCYMEHITGQNWFMLDASHKHTVLGKTTVYYYALCKLH